MAEQDPWAVFDVPAPEPQAAAGDPWAQFDIPESSAPMPIPEVAPEMRQTRRGLRPVQQQKPLEEDPWAQFDVQEAPGTSRQQQRANVQAKAQEVQDREDQRQFEQEFWKGQGYESGYLPAMEQRGYSLLKNLAAGVGSETGRKYWEQKEESIKLIPMGTLEEAKNRWDQGDYTGALSQISGAFGDTLATSMVDMAALATGPAYIQARWHEHASNRAKAKGMDTYGNVELLETLPGTLASIALDYAGAGKAVKVGQELAGEVADYGFKESMKQAGKAGLEGAKVEGLTETTQSGLEQLSETFMTPEEKPFDEFVKQALAEGAAGAALGFGLGANVNVLTQAQDLRTEIRRVEELDQLRRAEVGKELLRKAQLDPELLGEIGSPLSASYVGPLTTADEMARLEFLDNQAAAILYELGGTIEPVVRDPSIPVEAKRQGLMQSLAIPRSRFPKQDIIDSLLQNKSMVEDKGIYYAADIATYEGTFDRAKNLLSEMRDILDPTAEFVLTTTNNPNHGGSHTIFGTSEGGWISEITYNPDALRKAAIDRGIPFEVSLATTLAHELGHMIHRRNFNRLSRRVQRALLNDYRQWLRKGPLSHGTREWWRERNSQFGGVTDVAGIQAQWAKGSIPGAGPFRWNYWGNFAEFMAEQTARYVTRHVVKGKGTLSRPEAGTVSGQSVLDNLAQDLKKIYDKTVSKLPQYKRVYPAFENYLDSLRYQSALAGLREKFGDSSKLAEGTEDALLGQPTGPETVLTDLAATVKAPPPVKKTLKEVGRQTARFNTFLKYALTLPQIERENGHIPGVRNYVEAVRRWWRTKSQVLDRASETLRMARELKVETRKQDLKKFEKFVFALTELSARVERRINAEELAQLVRDTGVTQGGLDLYARMDEDFRLALDRLQRAMEMEAKRELEIKDVVAYQARLKDIEAEFQILRNRNYFPLSRFGNHAVSVKDRKGGIIYFRLWESKKDAQLDYERLNNKYSNDTHRLDTWEVDDRLKSLVDMPAPLIRKMMDIALDDFMKNMPEGLSPEDLTQMLGQFHSDISKDWKEAKLDYSPGKKYLQRMKERKFTPGFSEDALRSYASYMQSFANYIARFENSADINAALDEIGIHRAEMADQRAISQEELRKISKLQNSLRDHTGYLMNPGNEFASLRALGAHLFLGFSPRAALVNLLQVPTATYAFLAARHGDGKAVLEITRGYKNLKAAWTRGRAPGLDSDVVEAIEWGIDSGFINENLATELGVYAEGGNLRRALPGWVPKGREINYALKQYMHYSMWLFQNMEKVNRLVTFQAAYKLARDAEMKASGVNATMAELELLNPELADEIKQKAQIAGREAVETTQGEYSRWARPRGMQGKKSVAFLFKLYLQHMVYFIARDPGALRFLATQFAIGGALGMPFAGNVEDLLNALLKLLPEYTNKKPDVEKFVRESVMEMTGGLDTAADLLLHGAGRYGLGALWPFDLSPSLSLGQIVPGTEMINREAGQGNVYEQAGRTMEALGGPLAGYLFSVMKAVSADELNDWKQAERAMPRYAAAMSKALRWATQGEEQGFRGESIVDFDIHDPYQALEILGQAGGFTPRRVAVEKEIDWAQKEAERFYQARSQQLMRQYWEVWEGDDREGMSDVLDAIDRFNSEVPYPEIYISGKALKQSIKKRFEGQLKAGEGMPDSRKYQRLYDDIADSFPGRSEPSP